MSTYTLTLITGGYAIEKDGLPCIKQLHIPGQPGTPIPDDQREALGQQEITNLAALDAAASVAAPTLP